MPVISYFRFLIDAQPHFIAALVIFMRGRMLEIGARDYFDGGVVSGMGMMPYATPLPASARKPQPRISLAHSDFDDASGGCF